MDCSISPNYQNISFSFRLKYWEVSSAIHISSGIEVSIWKFIYSDINSKYSEAEIFSYLSKYRSSLVASQHMHHFNILRIFEISTENDPLSFSSERVIAPLSQEKNITNDEAYFMISQLCAALHFLHQDLHIAYLSISPDNIFFAPYFNLKIANLVHFGKFSDYDSVIDPNLYPLNSSIFDIDPRFASPETRKNKSLTSYSDVYSFALFIIFLFTNEVPNEFPINVTKLNIPDDLKEIVEQCLVKQYGQRPTFEQLFQTPSLNPVMVRVLNFIPKINESSYEIRENFYEKLSGIITNYSPRILSLKFVPIMTKEITENKELMQQLLPILLLAAEKINPLDTYNLICQPLFKIEQCANYFFEKALTMTEASVFVPILISSYKSNFKSISSRKHELLKSIDALENINSIICLIENLEDEVIIESILRVFENKIDISNSVLFIRQLKHIYKKFSSNLTTCNSITNMVLTIPPSSECAPKAVSLLFSLTKSPIHKKDKEKLIKSAEQFLRAVRESVESEPEETKAKVIASKSSNQILFPSFISEIDDDFENLSPRRSKKEKKHKEKKDKKNRRSSLTSSSSMRKLQLNSTKNNSFSNSQKLFQLPRGINPLSLMNPFIREIDQFSFREYINADTPPFTIVNSDPFEYVRDKKRRLSEISVEDSVSSSESKETFPAANIPAIKMEDIRSNGADKGHRRALSSRSLSRFPSLNDSNQRNPFSARNTAPIDAEKGKNSLSIHHRSDNDISDDDSGPFKVSNRNSFFSNSSNTGLSSALRNFNTAGTLEKSASTKIKSFSFDFPDKNDEARNSSSLISDNISATGENDNPLNSKLLIKGKKTKSKSRPCIPTPPPKKIKKSADEQ